MRGCIRLREELCTPGCICPKSLLEVSLCGKSCVDQLVKILLCEGRDVELGARTSKHIFLFVFDQLTLNSLSLFICVVHLSYCHIIFMLVLCLALIHSSYIYMLGCVCLCASLVFNHESFIYHLNSYSEESRGVSPEPFTGNSATLVS